MIVFCGDNSFASYHAAKEYAQKLATKNSSELMIINGDELILLSELRDYFNAVGLFGDSKTILAKRLFKNKALIKDLATDTHLINESQLVCWEEGKVDGKLNLVKNLKQQESVQEFTLPKDYLLPELAIKQAQHYKLSLTKTVATELVYRCGNNLWIIDSELQKLATYISTHPGPLSRDLIIRITSDTREQPIWKFLDAVGQKQRQKMLAELRTLLDKSTDIHYIIAMLQRELRLIAEVKYSQKHHLKSSLNPYVEKSMIGKIDNFTWSQLKQNYLDLLKLDTALKNGEVEDVSALIVYLLNM